MEEYIGSALLFIVSILTYNSVLDNPIIETTSANEIVAVLFSLTGIAFGLMILLSE